MAYYKIKNSTLYTTLFVILLLVVPLLSVSQALAQGGSSGSSSCTSCECTSCQDTITDVHEAIREHVTEEFIPYREWLIEDFYLNFIVPSLMLMAEQLTAVGMLQVTIIGSFFDAKHQLETQRLFQTLVAEAHKDYHPSEGICEIGTGVRSLASSERKAYLNQIALANRMMQRQLLSTNTLSGEGSVSDRESRLLQYTKVFCNPNDNAGGLGLLCGNGGNYEQYNMDVDYANAVENKLTLAVDFDAGANSQPTTDEENIFALGANLFAHQVLPVIGDRLLADGNNRPKALAFFYLRQRAIAAKRSVAQNSFAAITAMRSEGNNENAPFLRAIIEDLGVSGETINGYIGNNPSYFAQMEIMTKKMYQNPTFYANLYDKPVNVERKGAALQAIALMQDRDIYESLLRSEAVLATLLETLAADEHARISRDLSQIKGEDEKVKN